MRLTRTTELGTSRPRKTVGLIAAMALTMAIGNSEMAWSQATEPVDVGFVQAGTSSAQTAPSRFPGNPSRPANAANLTNASRKDAYNDFLRVLWVPAGVAVTSITLGKRAFFTASNFFKPAAKVDAVLNFVGNYYRDGQDLVILRCRPTPAQRQHVSPILATWPNVLAAIASDLGGPSRDCSSPNLSTGEKQICSLAIQYADFQQNLYVDGLRQATELASQLYAMPESTNALRKDYGIFPAFTGLGFTVQASSTSNGKTAPMLTANILANSVVPEYLLINAKLGDASCRCVQVPEYQQRHSAPIDPVFIWNRGKLDQGACRRIRRLASSIQPQ